LILELPPRHGKSTLVSEFFPAWFLLRFPDLRVMLCSYEADFAKTWGRKVRDLVGRHGGTVGVGVSGLVKAGDRWDLVRPHRGGMVTAGVGGAITGRGADLLVVDDPVKNAEEANSAAVRGKVWDWYQSTAFTRLEPGGRVVVIMTRWNEADLVGRLLEESDEPWRVVCLPALAEEGDLLGRLPGEALWPERYPVDVLGRIRGEVGGYWFSALYQQRPQPVEGGLLRRGWLRCWDVLPPVHELVNFTGWDLAISSRESADWTASCTGSFHPGSGCVFVRDWSRERLSFPEQVEGVKGKFVEWRPGVVGVESVAYQDALPQQLEVEDVDVPVLPVKRTRDKVTRFVSSFLAFERGKVFLPRGHPLLGEFVHEWVFFPNGRYDDLLDATETMLSLCFGSFGFSPRLSDDRYDFNDYKMR
jgi:predicted phage terminase large subunit-like protein